MLGTPITRKTDTRTYLRCPRKIGDSQLDPFRWQCTEQRLGSPGKSCQAQAAMASILDVIAGRSIADRKL